jgi:two-component system OmpR family response regulator
MSILLIEDDLQLVAEIQSVLRPLGLRIDHVDDASTGLEKSLERDYDLVVTDRMLPAIDGLGIVEGLRAAGRTVPILVISALDSVDDRVRGLRAGGDDYLGKPFAPAELLARVESLLRRSTTAAMSSLTVDDLELDLLAKTATRGGKVLELTEREYRLLEFLARHAGQVVTRSMLLRGVWDIHYDPQTNVVDVHVSRLRQSVDKEFSRPLIHTIRGIGYILRGSADMDRSFAKNASTAARNSSN